MNRVLPSELSIANVMSLRQTVTSMATASKGKAHGPVPITNDLLALRPASTARHMHALMAKFQLTCAESFASKGGYAHAFQKGINKLIV